MGNDQINGERPPESQFGGIAVLPRLLRLRDAPRYLGMDKNRFNREVRPWVTVIRIGRQGIAFDRLDLDAWVDEYKRSVRPAAKNPDEATSRSGPSSGMPARKSTRTTTERAFRRAVERAISRKP